MIPYQLDPTLHPAQPAPPRLDDGCSPPTAQVPSHADADGPQPAPVDPALWAKSEF